MSHSLTGWVSPSMSRKGWGPLGAAETFTFEDESGVSLSDVARLDTMVTVVDGPQFLRDFKSIESLQDRDMAAGEEDERSIAELLTDQIEFANSALDTAF